MSKPEAANEDSSRTADRLIEQVRQHPVPASDESSRQRLGEFLPQPPPRNWWSGPRTNRDRSDGTPLPDRAEVVDRWLAADGSYNVIVDTTFGERLCGRAEAWNPMSPLVEPVMMFRACGRGKPTFEMERPKRDR